MSSSIECIPAAFPQTLEEARAYVRDIRADLTAGSDDRRTDGLRRLYVEIAERGDLWFDRLGHVARVDEEEGFEAGLVELVLCLVFPDEWAGAAPAPG
jgi:hypothetical protein